MKFQFIHPLCSQQKPISSDWQCCYRRSVVRDEPEVEQTGSDNNKAAKITLTPSRFTAYKEVSDFVSSELWENQCFHLLSTCKLKKFQFMIIVCSTDKTLLFWY